MGARTYWRAPVPPLGYADGATASTAATLVDISPVPPVQIPPIWELGTRLHVKAYGWYTTTTSALTNIWGIYLAPVATVITSSYLIAASGAQTLGTSVTQVPWWLQLEGEVRALSTATATANTASMEVQGWLMVGSTLTAYSTPVPIPVTYALRTVAFTSNIPQNLQIGATTSATTASVACNHLDVELGG